jgi:hypothetical protein
MPRSNRTRFRYASFAGDLSYTANSLIKAAFYSAAFIVRAAVAQELDIDPEELDVSGLRQVELEDTGEKVAG